MPKVRAATPVSNTRVVLDLMIVSSCSATGPRQNIRPPRQPESAGCAYAMPRGHVCFQLLRGFQTDVNTGFEGLLAEVESGPARHAVGGLRQLSRLHLFKCRVQYLRQPDAG